MLKVELVPDLTHCIETVAKKEHASLLQRLLTPGTADKELEEKLEILRVFLERADFKRLRAESEKQLTAGRGVKFTVYLDNGMPEHEMQVT